MNASDVFIWIVIGGAILFVVGFAIWALFSVIKVTDEITEEEWNEYCRKDEERMRKE